MLIGIISVVLIILIGVLWALWLKKESERKDKRTHRTFEFISTENESCPPEDDTDDKKTDFIVCTLTICFTALIFLFAGIFMMYKDQQFLKHAKETTAVITDVTIHEYTDEDKIKRETRTISFTYTVDGKEYTNETKQEDESYSKGHEIKIYYDPDNPAESIEPNGSKDNYLFYIIFGSIFFVSPFVCLIFKKTALFIKNKIVKSKTNNMERLI